MADNAISTTTTRRNSQSTVHSTQTLSQPQVQSNDQSKIMMSTDAQKSKSDDVAIKCPDCDKTVLENQRAVECDICNTWFHCPCQKVSAAMYKLLNSDENENISWYCNGCKRGAKKLMSQIININERQNQVEIHMVEIEKRQDSTEQRVQEIENKVDVKIETKMKDNMSELEDRQKRRKNVIISNLDESATGSSDTDKVEDKLKLETFLRDINSIEPTEVQSFFRLGKRSEDKPRLVKLILKSEESKDTLIQQSIRYNKDNHDKPTKIYANPDFTPQQADANKALRSELSECRKLHPNDLFQIRNNKVVKVDPNRTQPKSS